MIFSIINHVCQRAKKNKRAKNIYFDYIGSRFFMDRDGIYPTYAKFKVSKEKEQKWLKELTEIKLKALKERGNWKTIFFLNQHSDFEHLNEILNSEPLGEYWEKCSFLEQLYEMTEWANFSKTDNKRVLDYILLEGQKVLEETETPDRINKLLNEI